MIGQRIGSYTVTEKIGEGGMGVVYRATDNRLHRDVALKFIPEALAKDPHIMGRFEREAQVLASLNHPNIAAIYGLEENGGQPALVMELVEGEELAARLGRGAPLLEEALGIALEIALALEVAHDRGVIHRDLKPANIKIKPADGTSATGRVKILDFGLAKALEGGSGAISSDQVRSQEVSLASTQAGMILGTAGYMSPEQARALPVDRRADIWSFGAILYELLSGRRAFHGETMADTLAMVIERDPDWSLLPPSTPPAIKTLIERCLVKSPRQRLQAIGDARLVLEETLANPPRPLSAADAAPLEGRAASRPRWLGLVPWVIAAGALAWAVAASLDRPPPGDPMPQMRVDIVTRSPLAGLGASLGLTPDGSRLIYVEGGDDSHDLLLRPLDGGEPTLLASGNSASLAPIHAFLSPDGKWVGFVTMTELNKVPLSGGPPQRICDVTRSRGATWLPDDTIVFAPTFSSGLMRVKASGGEPQRLTELDAASGEIAHRWPYALPDGDHILFSSHNPGGATATIEAVSIKTGERKVVHRGGAFPRYVPTGYLVFVNADKLFAAPFDLRTLELKSAPVPVLDGVATADMYGSALFAFSENGLLAYVARAPQATSYPIVWVDRDGATSPLLGVPGAYACPQLSPDGRRLALTVLRDDNWDIWVHDLERDVATRLTFDPSSETEQVWSPDGRYLIFSSDREGQDSLYRKRADGSGESERLTTPEKPHWASSWSRDGRYVAYVEAADFYDIGYLDLETRETRTILSTPYGELYPDISPDGRWLAYASNESGGYAIYVVPFPTGEGRWQVSDDSGSNPRWSGDGRELFWRTDEGIVVASVDTADGSLHVGKVRKLFEGPFHGGGVGVEISGLSLGDYAVSRDGQRFVMFPDSEWAARGNHTHITLVTRWFDQLERAVGSAAK